MGKTAGKRGDEESATQFSPSLSNDSGSAASNHELMSKIILESRQVSSLNQALFEQLNQAQKTIDLLKRDVALLQNQQDALVMNPRIKFLEEQLREKDIAAGRLHSEIEKLNEHIQRLQEEKNIADIENEKLASRLKTKDGIIEEFGRNLAEKEKEHSRFFEERKRLESSLQSATLQLKEKDRQILLLQKELEKKSGRLKELRNALEEKEREKLRLLEILKKSDEERGNLVRKTAELLKNIRILTDDLQIKDRIVHETQRKNIETNKKLSNLQRQLAKLNERISILEEANTEAVKKFEKTDSRAKMLEKELSHQKTINENLKAYYTNLLRIAEKKYETRIKALIADHTRRELELKTKIETMRRAEEDFTTQSAIDVRIPGVQQSILKPSGLKARQSPEENKEHPAKTESSKKSIAFSVATPEEIVPMVKTAFDHGDSEETIKKSLLNAGYSPVVVEKAIRKATQKN